MAGKRSITTIAKLAVSAMLLPLAAHAAAPATFGTAREVAQITAIENAAAQQTDVNNVLGYYAPNAIVADYLAPGWYKGIAQIRADFQPQMAAIKSVKAQMREINVAADSKFACAMMQIHFDATTKDGATHAIDLRQLDAFKKIDGHWRIIQEQISVPVQPNGTPVFVNPAAVSGPLQWESASQMASPIPVAEAKAQIYKWLVASEVPTSVNQMSGFYGPGDDFILSDFWSPKEIRGHQALLNFYGPQYPAVKNMQINIPFVNIQTDGAFGVQISEQDLTLNMKDGSKQRYSFRQSDCVRRVGNGWYSFFEMGSFPIDMQTGKAIMLHPAEFK